MISSDSAASLNLPGGKTTTLKGIIMDSSLNLQMTYTVKSGLYNSSFIPHSIFFLIISARNLSLYVLNRWYDL